MLFIIYDVDTFKIRFVSCYDYVVDNDKLSLT